MQITRVWKDSWISLDSSIKPIGPVTEAALDLTVAYLLTTDMKWNKQRIESLLPTFADKIQCLQPSVKGAEDAFIWLNSKSGAYTTRSGYFAASLPPAESNNGTSDNDFDWIKDVWAGEFSPKMRAFLWSVIQNALPLGSNLQSRGNISALHCIRCQQRETAIHCFFTCPFAETVWKLIPLLRAVHIAATTSVKDAVVQFRKIICLPPTGITHNILPWVLWTIWILRNLLIFEKRKLSPEETANKGIWLAREWTQAQVPTKKSKDLPSIDRDEEDPQRLIRSADESLICMTDAAWDKNEKKAGFGWVFTGRGLDNPIHGSMGQSFINTPLIAEAIAMRSALCMALTLNFPSVRVFSENLTLIRAINGKLQSKEIIGVVSDIRSVSSGFASIVFFHLPRSKNTVADSIAKTALRVFLYV